MIVKRHAGAREFIRVRLHKADEPGWASLVPFYREYVLYKISLGNGWLFLLELIPVVGTIAWICMRCKLSWSFKKGIAFTILMILLPPVAMLIIGVDGSRYVGVVPYECHKKNTDSGQNEQAAERTETSAADAAGDEDSGSSEGPQ